MLGRWMVVEVDTGKVPVSFYFNNRIDCYKATCNNLAIRQMNSFLYKNNCFELFLRVILRVKS
jgi:hypothetical protein